MPDTRDSDLESDLAMRTADEASPAPTTTSLVRWESMTVSNITYIIRS